MVAFVGFDSANTGAPHYPNTYFAAIEGVAIDVADDVESGQIIMTVMNPGGPNDTLNDLLHIGGRDGQSGENACAVVINEAGIDSDFRVESDVNNSAIFLQGSDGDFRLNYLYPHSEGTGIGEAARLDILVRKVNFEMITTIIINIEGLQCSETDDDVIGDNGESNPAYIFSSADEAEPGTTGPPAGWIYKAEMICLETPAGTDVNKDIDLSASTVGTWSDSDLVTGSGTRIKLIDAGGNWARDVKKESSSSTLFTHGLRDNFIYLTAGASGAGSGGTYTAGKFAIKLYGFQSF